MSTYPSWRVAAENLRKLTSGITRKQRELAARVGLKLPKSLPSLVAAARLKEAYATELCIEPIQPATDSQLEFLSNLNKKRARDPQVTASRIEASAWIDFYLRKKHYEALERLRLVTGDIVQIKNSGGARHEEVVSIAIDGRIYFRGGHGASASPERVTLKCRAANKSAKARALRKVTANQAAARSTSTEFSRVKELELKDFRVTSRATPEDIEQFRNVIDNARDEKPIQTFLENNPQVLAALLGGRSRVVVPHPKLGGKRIPDFLIADVDSCGINWVFVELETPLSAVTLKDERNLEKHARKGVSQINEWRHWVENNLELARRSRTTGGLGLVDISSRCRGLVLVGRRSRLKDNASEVRGPIRDNQRIDVHTYDYLLDRLESTLSFIGPSGLNPNLIQPWRDGDDEQPTVDFDKLVGGMGINEPLVDFRKPFTTGKK